MERCERVTLSVVILGTGGHAAVLFDAVASNPDYSVVGFCDNDPSRVGKHFFEIEIFSENELMDRFSNQRVHLINGVGAVKSTPVRQSIFDRFKDIGYSFASVRHPSAIVAKAVRLGEGTQLMAGSIVQVRAEVGENSIVNTGASVDHDCKIGNHVHLSPGSTLSGGVRIGDGTHVGTGAVVIEGICLGNRVTIGAGAVVVNDIADDITAVGIPARPSRST